MISSLYDRETQLDEERLTNHCKDMLDMIYCIKPTFEILSQDDYIRHATLSAGMLYHHIDRLRDAASRLSWLHLWLSDICSNAGKYHERQFDEGMYVVRLDENDEYVKINYEVKHVEGNTDYLMESLTIDMIGLINNAMSDDNMFLLTLT